MNSVAVTAGELLISEIVGYISELVPINVEKTKNRLSMIISKYHIKRVEQDETHPDLLDNIKLYLAAIKLEGYSPYTIKGYELELNKFAKYIKKRTADINSADIRVYLAQFENLQTSTIGHKLTILKSFFGWLAGEEIIQKDPTVKLKTPKEKKRIPKALTIEELEMLREGCQSNRQRALIEVLYATGCRLSEIHDLDISSIDHQSMSAQVIGKGNKERTVYFSFRAMYHLKKYLESRTDDNPALFITQVKPYRRLSKRGIQREVSKIAEQAGLKNVSPHVLRHTFATLTLNNGAELAAVQALLGHESPDTTLVYAQLTEDKKYEAHKKYLVM